MFIFKLWEHIYFSGAESVAGREVEELLNKMSTDELTKHFTKMFSKVIDGEYLTDDPVELYRRGQFHPVELLCGFNTHEGLMFINLFTGGGAMQGKEEAISFIQMSLKQMYLRGNSSANDICQKVVDMYINELTEADCNQLTEQCVAAQADCQFTAPTVLAASLHSGIYIYIYIYRSL